MQPAGRLQWFAPGLAAATARAEPKVDAVAMEAAEKAEVAEAEGPQSAAESMR